MANYNNKRCDRGRNIATPFLVWTCVSPIVRDRAVQNNSVVAFPIANAAEAVLL
jgi:hypothetical protein